jgi:DNA helicase HerA-like ATPase
MTMSAAARDAVLRVGEVTAVEGRRIYVLVDKKKNLSHMFLDGDLITNIAVNNYVAIRKGFLSIIGRVEGERIEEDFRRGADDEREPTDRNKRILTVALTGYIDERGRFSGGTRELPLIGNEAFLLTREQLSRVHDLVRDGEMSISIATLYGDDLDVRLPVDGLFNSHIAIFGNTGSGKSNTLAFLYQELVKALVSRNQTEYEAHTRFLLFDFNGEYTKESCIWAAKHVYNLSTRNDAGDKIPMDSNGLLDVEVLAILADATEKTQKPFLVRALRLLATLNAAQDGDPGAYFRNMLRQRARAVLQMTDKLRAALLVDYFRQILPALLVNGEEVEIDSDIEWHNTSDQYRLKAGSVYLQGNLDAIGQTRLYQHITNAQFGDDMMSDIISALYLQIVSDVLNNRAQNEHIAPMINRLIRKRHDIEKLFDVTGEHDFWASNFVVINLDEVNLDMRKTVPLLLSKKLYAEHKETGPDRTLTIIIDEAHNILSTESFREAESWKDYRLETFEEIIKEGRKFGVFVTIASQRPNDISPTITSQAHNYFIHRLINEKDLQTIASAVSYIDRVTEESIPTLPTGTCIFSGVASAMPLKLNVKALTDHQRPESTTRSFSAIIPALPPG